MNKQQRKAVEKALRFSKDRDKVIEKIDAIFPGNGCQLAHYAMEKFFPKEGKFKQVCIDCGHVEWREPDENDFDQEREEMVEAFGEVAGELFADDKEYSHSVQPCITHTGPRAGCPICVGVFPVQPKNGEQK
mgnify:FL=1